MNKKTYILGSLIMTVAFCALILLNSAIVPSVLAITPEKGELKTTTTASIEPTAEPTPEDASPEPVTPDITAIAEEKAMELAVKALKESENIDVSTWPNKTRLVKSTPPLNGTIWSVAFYKETQKAHSAYTVSIDAATGEINGTGLQETIMNGADDSGEAYFCCATTRTRDGKYIWEINDNDGLLVAVCEVSEEEMKNHTFLEKFLAKMAE